jgi:Family of unknown function (DUF5677)
MPTKAPEGLYSPERIKAQLRPLLDIATPLLGEVLQYGLALFARCSNRPEGGNENVVILLLYYHILELLDSVAIQVSECAVSPAALQLRAIFEALLGVKYLTEDKSKTQRRGDAYLYKIELRRRHFHLSQGLNTDEGKVFQEFIKDDPDSKTWKWQDSALVAERVKHIDTILDKPEFKEIASEYKRTAKKRRYPEWYALDGGPENIAQLAKRLKLGAHYELLYREWSERTHGVDTIDRILKDNKSQLVVRGLRDPSELITTIDFAVHFTLEATRCLIRYYRPAEEEKHDKWYREEISPLWNSVPEIEERNSGNGDTL